MTTAQKERKAEMQLQSVYYGDCLKHLTHWNNWNRWDENNNARLKMDRKLADLIYLDPPWNSKTKYNILYERAENKAKGHTAQSTAFNDIWHWTDGAAERLARLTKEYISPNDALYPLLKTRECIAGLTQVLGKTGMLAYLTFMAERLALCRELLKETGSIYLHCDPTASHYLKLVMDAIFGVKNFLNEIIWYYRGAGVPKMSRAKRHDVLFWYAKDATKFHHFNPDPIRQPYAEATKKRFSNYIGNVRGGRDYGTQSLNPIGKHPDDVITHIQPIAPSAKERRGYPTQKPELLLKELIASSTAEGDVVLDPFCGCGPAIVAAHNLNRQFVGIDLSLFTVQSVVRVWLEEIGLGGIRIAGIPEDLASARKLAIDDPFDFETFAIELCHPAFKANVEQRKDGGTDGRGFLLQPIQENGQWKNEVLVQVKGGERPPSKDKVEAFARRIEKTEEAVCGVFITVEEKHWGNGMKKIAREMGKFEHPGTGRKYPKLQNWYLKKADLRAREETMFEGLPNLPDLLGLDKKPLIPKQADFSYWKPTEDEN